MINFGLSHHIHKNKRSVAKQRRQENAMSLSLKISQSCQKVENFLMLIVNDWALPLNSAKNIKMNVKDHGIADLNLNTEVKGL